MITNESCTVYCYNKSTKGYDRYLIPECFWDEVKSSNVVKSGLTTADSIFVYIPGLYAQSAPKTANKDYIVKGECSFEFNNDTQQSVSQSVIELKSNNDVYIVSSIDYKLYGGKELQHIKISAK